MELSPLTLTLALPCVFVAVLYAIPGTVRRLPRNDPKHVKYRMLSLIPVMLAGPLLTHWALGKSESRRSLLEDLGASPACFSVHSTLQPLLLISLLFLGPLVQLALRTRKLCGPKPALSEVGVSTIAALDVDITLHPILHFRTYVFAPVVEEWIFRACILPAWALTGRSVRTSILAASLAFGLAHAHHGYEMMRSGHPLPRVILTVLVQLSYTSLFGGIAAWLLLTYGNVWSVILTHCFCNVMGLPDASAWATPSSPLYDKRKLIAASYVAGLVGFIWVVSSIARGDSLHALQAPCSLLHQMRH